MRQLLEQFSQQIEHQRQLVQDGARAQAGVLLAVRFWRDKEGQIRASARLRAAQLYEDPLTSDALLHPQLSLEFPAERGDDDHTEDRT